MADLRTITDRLALIIDGLCRAVAASGATGPLVILIWARLRRIAGRFAASVARIRSVAPAPASVFAPDGSRRAPRPAAPRPVSPNPASPQPPQRLPIGFGWLLPLAPAAAGYGGQLSHLLAEPDVAALLAASPRLGRVLRPLCRMLGVEPGLLPAPPARPVSPGRRRSYDPPSADPTSANPASGSRRPARGPGAPRRGRRFRWPPPG